MKKPEVYKISLERVEKIRKSHTGLRQSEATREKLRELSKGRPSWMKGKHMPPEYREKIRNAKLGKPISDLTRLRVFEHHHGGVWYGNVKYSDTTPKEEIKYCEKFNENLKERVRAFFGYECVICGEPEGDARLHVHHVWYNKKMCCDETRRSLVALCPKCHMRTNHHRDYWSRTLQEMLDTIYDGKCWITREEYAELTSGSAL